LSSSFASGWPFSFRTKFGPKIEEQAFSPTSPEHAEEDETLLFRIKSGDREALGILFIRYARLVLSVGIRVLHDAAETEDLVHDVFLLVLNKVDLFDPKKGTARGWLAKISYHQALDRRAYLARRSFYDTRNGSDPESSAAVTDPRSGIELVELSYWQSVLQQSFDCLSPDQRITIQLHFFDGLTVNEISERLKISPVNVRNYYYRGLQRLRQRMFHRFDEVAHDVISKSRIADLKGNSR